MNIDINKKQRKKFEDLWFIYGNNGQKHTMSNHKFIQGFLEHGKDLRKFYKPSITLIKKVDKIIKG